MSHHQSVKTKTRISIEGGAQCSVSINTKNYFVQIPRLDLNSFWRYSYRVKMYFKYSLTCNPFTLLYMANKIVLHSWFYTIEQHQVWNMDFVSPEFKTRTNKNRTLFKLDQHDISANIHNYLFHPSSTTNVQWNSNLIDVSLRQYIS